MNDKNIFLHIGTPKTGSSALQKFLLNNGKELNRQNFCYPEHKVDINNISSGNGFEVIKILNQSGESAARDYLVKLFANVKEDNVIISSEVFFRNPGIGYKLFPNAKIVVYFRSQLGFIESIYNQSVKRLHQKKSFVSVVNEKLNNKDDINSFELLKDWGQLFGYENIILRVYEKSQFSGGTIFSDFISSIGLVFNQKFNLINEPVNISYSRDALEYKLLLNSLFDEDINQTMHNKIDQGLQRFSNDYYKQGGIHYSLYNSELRKRVTEFYSEANEFIAKEILKREDGILFFESDLKNSSDSYQGLSNKLIVELTLFIIDMFPELSNYFAKKIIEGINSENIYIKFSACKLASILSIPAIYRS